MSILKDLLFDYFYSRRTIDDKLFRGHEIHADFVSEDDVVTGALVKVESSDIDRNEREISLTVYLGVSDVIATIYMSPEDAKELALALYEPPKG